MSHQFHGIALTMNSCFRKSHVDAYYFASYILCTDTADWMVIMHKHLAQHLLLLLGLQALVEHK